MKTISKLVILVFLTFILLTGCAGTGQNLQPQVSNTPHQNEQQLSEADFDPMQLNDYGLEIASGQQNNYYTIDDLLKADVKDTTGSDEMASGYRVQLISTRLEEEARTVKMDAVLTFKENVYTIFDNPNYKIRVGDCLTRYDANTLQELAVKKGFNEAWVVKTNVFRNPVLQHLSRDIQE